MHAQKSRLGADFFKLWTASAISNLGDGVTAVAAPLLVASMTDEPLLVAGAAFVQQLPWLLFALVSGALADRLDRQRLIVAVNLLRGLAVAVLAAALVMGVASVPLVYIVFFLLGTGETLADTASAARLPTVVPPERLATANARLMATFTVINQFAAKPVGAWLFVVAVALPFGVNAVTFVVAALLVAWMRPVPGEVSAQEQRQGIWGDVAAGMRWLWRHRLLRTLALTMGVGNVVFCGAFAVFVLYADERLGLSEVGYGLLLVAFAVGGAVGTLVAPRLQARVGAAALLRAGLVIEMVTHLVLAVTTHPWIAAVTLTVFSVHAMVWGVIVVTLRQRAVPEGLLGRVTGVYSLLDLGGAAVGSLLGGLLAGVWGITAPYFLAGAVMAVVTLAVWPILGREAATVR
ncbi:MFS transporter [Sinosporangium siamense]|uniref:MFS transporter n=1 Tax=Sinosporangium siamense TaxID=1367973 RepID=A0A919RGG8_9ACTN|nr:MFS transporter [Sinosporangium siamense]GII93445.1 MFS transporter [Sinosporangium siamense]